MHKSSEKCILERASTPQNDALGTLKSKKINCKIILEAENLRSCNEKKQRNSLGSTNRAGYI